MKNLAKLKLQTEQQKGKTKPMMSARTARAVPQLRRVAKQLTGRKDGGEMTKDKDRLTKKDIEMAEKLTEGFTTNPTEKLKSLKNPKAKDRLAQGSAARLRKRLDKLIESLPKKNMKDISKILNRASKGTKEVLIMIEGKNKGGTMENPKKQDRRVGKYELKTTPRQTGRDKAKKVKEKIKNKMEQAGGFFEEIVGQKSGGVIRPKPTFQGKVLKPKPINKRGVGAAVRGFGTVLRKHFGGLR